MLAKPRPIALPIVSPASIAAEKPICTAKPIARPASTSPIDHRDPGDRGDAVHRHARTELTRLVPAMPTASATTSRNCTGTAAMPNTGAARKAAPGRIIATIHSQSCAFELGEAGGEEHSGP